MKKYLIQCITNHDGTARTDGKYPERVGSTVTMLEVKLANELMYTYITDCAGALKEGTFTGSSIIKYRLYEDSGDVEVTTLDSVFYFKHLGDYDGENPYVNKLLENEDSNYEMRITIRQMGIDDVTSLDLGTLLGQL